MAAGNGFLTERPDTVYDSGAVYNSEDTAMAQIFRAPGSGTLELQEIGCYIKNSSTSHTPYNKLAVFNHDSANYRPGSMVSNSESDAFAPTNIFGELKYHSYGTKPTVVAGNDYWLGIIMDALGTFTKYSALLSCKSGGVDSGDSLRKGCTYSTWPSWSSHTDWDGDMSLYTVYEQGASMVPIRHDMSGGFNGMTGGLIQ